MACATQTVVSQGIPNPLTAEDLLKSFPLQYLLPISFHEMVEPHKMVSFSQRNELQAKPIMLTLKL